MIRTRLAPSPTGFLHIGGVRTALYCYLLAKKEGGKFFLRIEDTDQKRLVEGAVENLLRSLHALGLDPDEGVMIKNGEVVEEGEHGPYTQSKRLDLYREHADRLLSEGKAYRCFCSPETLEVMRKAQMKQNKAPIYDRRCLSLSEEEIQQKLDAGEPHVIRQKIPHERGVVEFKDLIRGTVRFDCRTLDDQVLLKSDGFATYHLAHAVDDHLMKTNPVIRGEEWLPSMPKHVLLFEALGFEVPQYAHLPLLLGKDKSKLSKRDGDVAVEDYLRKGYLPEAILNFVAFLGWNPGDEREIFSLEELIQEFSLERVNKSGAVFNVEKLDWYNSHYIKEMDPKDLLLKLRPYFEAAKTPIGDYEEEYVLKVVQILQERLKYLAEAPEHVSYFFGEVEYDKDLILHEKMKVTEEIAVRALTKSLELLNSLDDFSEENLKEKLIELVGKLGLKNGQVLWPLRAVLTGVQFSPGAFEMAAVLGKERSMARIEKGLAKLQG